MVNPDGSMLQWDTMTGSFVPVTRTKVLEDPADDEGAVTGEVIEGDWSPASARRGPNNAGV